MRRSGPGRNKRSAADGGGGGGGERPRRLADTERDGPTTVRRRRRPPSAPFGSALPLGVAVAVVVAVAARAVGVAANGVLAASERSTLVALGLVDSLGSVAAGGALVARLAGLLAVVGAGYCVASAGAWVYLRRGDGDDRSGVGSRSDSRSR
ncbi:hypothetical protein [Halobaculum marinum]|uniref:Uncharacterized protein n=1 Tax=Halobaculum marinum TaxID=3031996 RepID=A0ABD5WTL9_9EURY|nr:hypothetical protein [Halobaculum sp. DT55]